MTTIHSLRVLMDNGETAKVDIIHDPETMALYAKVNNDDIVDILDFVIDARPGVNVAGQWVYDGDKVKDLHGNIATISSKHAGWSVTVQDDDDGHQVYSAPLDKVWFNVLNADEMSGGMSDETSI